MKRLIVLFPGMMYSLVVSAQAPFDPFQDKEMFADILHIVAALSGIYLISAFVVAIVKLFFDNRLKTIMIEKGLSDELISRLLNSNKADLINAAIRWFAILLGISIGLLVISFFQSFNIYSIVVMTFCISLSFLGYYQFLKRSR